MDCPDWYPAWRHEAVHQLQEKNARLSGTYRLGSWPRYDYNLDAGTLTFSEGARPKVVAEIQIAGSTSASAGNWLWAWGNAHWPTARLEDALATRAFGEDQGIEELTHDYIEDVDLNALGWEMTSVVARVTGAAGAYRPPRDEGGGLFVVYRNVSWAS